jgi:hypothetical protein
MKHSLLILMFFTAFTLVKLSAQECAGDEITFTWEGSDVGNKAVWNVDDTENTYLNVRGSGIDVKLTMDDPSGQNTVTGNPADDGSYTKTDDPWAPGMFMFQLTSTSSSPWTTLTFTFSTPVMLNRFVVGDIDALNSGSNANTYQDEVKFSATYGLDDVPLTLSKRNDAVFNITGQTATAIMGNNGVDPSDNRGKVRISSATMITTFSIAYSNGPADEGNSNSHAITLQNFRFCEAALLPIELSSFQGKLDQDAVQLDWATVSEVNSDHFEIERSVDGVYYENLGTVQAAGFSSQKIEYGFIDHNPKIGLNLYRLKHMDLDGTYQYSTIVKVDFQPSEFLVYPNPANEFIYVQNIIQHEFSSVEIFDLSGKRIKSFTLGAEGQYRNKIDLSDLARGTYFIKNTSSKFSKGRIFIKS